MIDTKKLFNELVDMGHSEKWALKKVEIAKIDELIQMNEEEHDACLNEVNFNTISIKLDTIEKAHDELCESRENLYSELKAIEAKEE